MRVPDEAAGGTAAVTVSMAGWKAGKVAPATFEVEVAGPTRPK